MAGVRGGARAVWCGAGARCGVSVNCRYFYLSALSVRVCAARDAALGAEVARAAQLVKGYGDVRRRMLALHEAIVAGVLRAAELESRRSATVAVSTALALKPLVANANHCEVIIAPVFTALKSVADRLEGSNIKISAQNCAAISRGDTGYACWILILEGMRP